MSAFDQVIGYDTIKEELLQVCDMVHNRALYESLGAKLPHGILLYGDPGLGKTLMAKCFIRESGLKSYTVRRNKSDDGFIDEITDAFRSAKENAPAIVFLDDMDKFANEDDEHCDAEEYVAVQAGIDDVNGCDVIVIATANDIGKLPKSLGRSGRFDRKICIISPSDRDAEKIIAHYLSEKRVSPSVNMEDLCKMISYNSCADLETIINEAAISAARARKDCLEMEDLLQAVLRMEYHITDNCTKNSTDDMRKIALHEAGHLVVCETLIKGSVGLASMRSDGHNSRGGFIHRCKDLTRRPHDILISLGGKVATELYYSEACASGCQSDLNRAFLNICQAITDSGSNGTAFFVGHHMPSEALSAQVEIAAHSELERYLFKTRDILLKNRDFLEKITEALMEKGTLLYSDIQAIRNSVTITEVEV